MTNELELMAMGVVPYPPEQPVSVKRYTESCMEGGGVVPDCDGELVGWSFYVAIEAERDELLTQVEAMRANSSLTQLLSELDEALEDLELHGRHDDQGYRKLKEWYRKMQIATEVIDAALQPINNP